MTTIKKGDRTAVTRPVPSKCCRCDQPAIGIGVSYTDIHRAEQGERELKARIDRDYPLNDSGFRAIPMSAYFTDDGLLIDNTARWLPLCADCDNDKPLYFIDYERFETVEQALDWTLHLTGKTWYAVTDWEQAVNARFPKVRGAA